MRVWPGVVERQRREVAIFTISSKWTFYKLGSPGWFEIYRSETRKRFLGNMTIWLPKFSTPRSRRLEPENYLHSYSSLCLYFLWTPLWKQSWLTQGNKIISFPRWMPRWTRLRSARNLSTTLGLFRRRCAYSTAQGATFLYSSHIWVVIQIMRKEIIWLGNLSSNGFTLMLFWIQSGFYDKFWNSTWGPCRHCIQGIRDAEQANDAGRCQRHLCSQDWSVCHPHLLGRLQPHLRVHQEPGGQLLLHEPDRLDLWHGAPKPEEWFWVRKHAREDPLGNASGKELLLHRAGQVLPVLQSREPGRGKHKKSN